MSGQPQTDKKVVFGFPEFWERVHAEYSVFFEAAFELEGLAKGVLSAAEKKAAEPVEKVVLMLTRVTVIGMNELVTLAGNGCGPGAMKIARGMFESALFAEYLRQNPTEVNDYIDFTHVIHWRRYQWLLEASPEMARELAPEEVKEFEDNYNRVKPRFADADGRVRNRWNQKSIAQMAREVGRNELYNTPYRLATSIHHANVEGLLAYIELTADKVTLDAPPSMACIPEALIAGHVYAIQALDTLNECCKLGFDEKIRDAGEKFKQVWTELRAKRDAGKKVEAQQ